MSALIIKNMGLQDYETTWQSMKNFTCTRTAATDDQIWLVEHFPVFTQGQNGKPEHILDPGCIPVVQSDRGGQITYHGPGQLIVYVMINLKRKNVDIRHLIRSLENTVIALLAHYNISAEIKVKAPGVYVNHHKIASVGLRIKQGCSYHGLSLNVNMDLSPFSRIHPCGFPELKMAQMCDFITDISFDAVRSLLISRLMQQLGYSTSEVTEGYAHDNT